MKHCFIALLFALFALPFVAAQEPDLVNSNASGIDTSAERTAWRTALELGEGMNGRLAAVIVKKDGTRTQYVATADTDAARGVALTNAVLAMTTGQTLNCAPGDYYMATTNLLLVDGCTYNWNGARLYINGSSASTRVGREASLDIALFTSGFATAPLNVSNWKFIGPLTLDGGSVGNRRGMWPIGTTGAVVDGVTFKNWGTAASGMGFYSFNSATKGNRMLNCYFDTCAGTGAEFNSEYWVVSNCHATACGYGFVESGGNTAFSNCSATYCTYGVRIMNTSNPGHGSWTGGNVNHSTTGIYTDPNITAAFGGFNFVGCVAHSTAFDLNGKGITWTGGEIANTTFSSSGTNSGISYFRGVRLLSTSTSESTSLAALTAAKRATIVFENCKTETGICPAWAGGNYLENWVIEGDSWSAGTAEGNDRETWPYYIASLAGPRVRIINAATAGTTAQSMVGTFATQCAPYLTATSGRPSKLFLFEGINDSSRTPTQIRDDLRTQATAGRAAGAQVIVFTLPFRSSGGGLSDADRITLNGYIIADKPAYYDVVVRTDLFWPNTHPSFGEGLHIVTAGHERLAATVMDSMNGRIATPWLTPHLVASGMNSSTSSLSSGAKTYLNYDELTDNGSNSVSSGSPLRTVFTCPVDGIYEMSATVFTNAGLASGNYLYVDPCITPPSSAESQLPGDYQTASGVNLTAGKPVRRYLTAGTTIQFAAQTNGTGVTFATNRCSAYVRFMGYN